MAQARLASCSRRYNRYVPRAISGTVNAFVTTLTIAPTIELAAPAGAARPIDENTSATAKAIREKTTITPSTAQ